MSVFDKLIKIFFKRKIQKKCKDDSEWLKLKSLAAKIRENQMKFKQLEDEKKKESEKLQPALKEFNERLKDLEYSKWFDSIYQPKLKKRKNNL